LSRSLRPDTRPHIADILAFTVSSDKQSYKLHEPIRLTMALSNRTDRTLEVARPQIDDRVVSLVMKHHSGGRLLNYHSWGSEEINPLQTVILQPGQSVSTTEIIEASHTSDYTLKAEFMPCPSADSARLDLRGRLRAEPVSFTVRSSPDDRALLQTKMDRLLTALRREHARAPDWDGWLPTVDDIADAGPEAAPYLIAAIEAEQDEGVVTRLYWALNRIASPDALPLYQEALRRADRERQALALAGLRELHARETPAQREALAAILAAAIGAHPDPVRAGAADYLSTIPDPAVKQTFEKAVADEDPIIAPTASRYLAASEGLNLADWLAAASQRPTHARFLAARFIIADLDKAHERTTKAVTGIRSTLRSSGAWQ